jgi:hypothetical protein
VAADREGADGHGWYAPELLRIKGDVLLQQAVDQSTLAAEDCFNQAAQMAREQCAVFWELRVALSPQRCPFEDEPGPAATRREHRLHRFTNGSPKVSRPRICRLPAPCLLEELPP